MFFKKTNQKRNIFRHILWRGAGIFLLFNIAYLGLMIPFAKQKSISLIENQAKIFINTTIAAIKDPLYLNDYSSVIVYVMNVIRDTPTIEYVIFNIKDGKKIIANAEKWELVENNTENIELEQENQRTIYHLDDSPYTLENVFEYTSALSVRGLDMGYISAGIISKPYENLLYGIYKFIIVLNVLLIVSTIIMLMFSSRMIGKNLLKLQSTANQLTEGDYGARAASSDIYEIDNLSESFNKMAYSIQEQTNRSNQLAQVVKNTRDGVVIVNESGAIEYANAAAVKMTGQDDFELIGKNVKEFDECGGMDTSIIEIITRALKSQLTLPWRGDTNVQVGDETNHFEVQVDFFRGFIKNNFNYFIVISDITARKKLEVELKTLAHYDKLTNLPNRRQFQLRLNESLNVYEHNQTGFTLMFIDLDDFKHVNDSLGHDYGDDLLVKFSKLLKSTLREGDIISRLGGDEFTVILPNITDSDYIGVIAQKILHKFQTPILVRDKKLIVSGSIGIVICPDDGENSNELIKKADLAMYESKAKGKNCFTFFTEQMNQNLRYYIETENDLRDAIENDDLTVWLQPQVALANQDIQGFEALVRWQHPKYGLVQPSGFIPIAEKSGLIIDIGNIVLQKVCEVLKDWKNAGIETKVSINISTKHLGSDDFIDDCFSIFERYSVNPKLLEFEFTESAFLEQTAKNLQKLDCLKEAGVSLAIDDFGTGYSSLSYLHKLPLDTIKLDKSFIDDVLVNKRAHSIVASVINLAEELGINIIAEGVENNQQADLLEALNCPVAQGYLFYKPMLVDDAKDLIRAEQGASPLLSIVK